MPSTTVELRQIVSEVPLEPEASVPAPTQRLTYRQEQSISPQRSDWSRSVSRLRDSSRARFLGGSKERSPLSDHESAQPSGQQRPHWDPRGSLPPVLARFLGSRSADSAGRPLFAWQDRIPRRLENTVLTYVASFASIIAIESVNIKSGLFEYDYHGVPLIIASLGASAVLLFSTFESPLSQPRNAIGGQMLSALTAVIINRLFKLNSAYSVVDPAPADEFTRLNWLSAALSMSTALLVMELTGTVHPPGGATALIVSVTPSASKLSWRFLLVIFVSIVIMVGIALIKNNLGHRKYPLFWWKADPPPSTPKAPLAASPSANAAVKLPSRSLEHVQEVDAAAEEDELQRRGRKPNR